MNLSFNEEQVILRDSVSRTLDKSYTQDIRYALNRTGQACSPELWRQLRGLGLLALPFDENVGGAGGSLVDVVAIAEKFGESLFLEPYASSILLAGRMLALASGNAQARIWLDRIVAGDAYGAFAYEEGRGTSNPSLIGARATQSKSGYRLTGEKHCVLGAAQADVMVVAARASGAAGDHEGLVSLVVDPRQRGVTMTPYSTLDGLPAAHVRFDDVDVDAGNVLSTDARDMLCGTIADATIVLSGASVGAMGVLLRLTSEYALNRTQFGVPIATFQAVAHRLADMKIAYTKARATLLYTTALAEAGQASLRDLSVLKGQIGKLGRAIGESAVQIHGGAGMTDEVAVGHYLKRVLTIDALFGPSEYHLRRVGAGDLAQPH